MIPAGNMSTQSSSSHVTLVNPTMTIAQSPLQQIQVIQQPTSAQYLQPFSAGQQQIILPANLSLPQARMTVPGMQSISASHGLNFPLQVIDPKTVLYKRNLLPKTHTTQAVIQVGNTTQAYSVDPVYSATATHSTPQAYNTSQAYNTTPVYSSAQAYNTTQAYSTSQAYTTPVYSGSTMKQYVSQSPDTTGSVQNQVGPLQTQQPPSAQSIQWSVPGGFQAPFLSQNPIIICNSQPYMLSQLPSQALSVPSALVAPTATSTLFPPRSKRVKVRPTSTTILSLPPKIMPSPITIIPQMATIHTQTSECDSFHLDAPLKTDDVSQDHSNKINLITPTEKFSLMENKTEAVETKQPPQISVKPQAMIAPSTKIVQDTSADFNVSTSDQESDTLVIDIPVLDESADQPNVDSSTENQTVTSATSISVSDQIKIIATTSVTPSSYTSFSVQDTASSTVDILASAGTAISSIHDTSIPTEPKTSISLDVPPPLIQTFGWPSIVETTGFPVPTSTLTTVTMTISSSPLETTTVCSSSSSVTVMTPTSTSSSPFTKTSLTTTKQNSKAEVSVSGKDSEHLIASQKTDPLKSVNLEERLKYGPAEHAVLNKSQVLVHVIDGFVIKESSKPFKVSHSSQLSDPSLKVTPLEQPEVTVPKFMTTFSRQGRGRPRKRLKGRRSWRKQNLFVYTDRNASGLENNAAASDGNPSSSIEIFPETSEKVSPPTIPNLITKSEANVNRTESRVPTISPEKWTVAEVFKFMKDIPDCSDYADTFKEQEIDGQALLLLNADHLMTSMCMKLGPAVKLISHINNLKEKITEQNS